MSELIPTGFIPIGQFAKQSGLSVPTLRFYAEQKLLEPASIDAQTKYRSYRPAQLEVAERIRMMRDLEMSLEDIRLMLGSDTEGANRLLERHDLQLRARFVEQRHTLERMWDLLRGKRRLPQLEVFEERWPAQWILSFRRPMRWDEFKAFTDESRLAFAAALEHHRVVPTGFSFAFQHHLGIMPDQLDVEACVPVPKPLLGVGAIRGGSLEPLRVMLTRLPGVQFTSLEVYQGLLFLLESQGVRVGAAIWREMRGGIEIGYVILESGLSRSDSSGIGSMGADLTDTDSTGIGLGNSGSSS